MTVKEPTASSVSAYLRRNGFTPVPNEPARLGVKVTRSYNSVQVSVDLDLEEKAKRWVDRLVELLGERYTVERNPQSSTILYVTAKTG